MFKRILKSALVSLTTFQPLSRYMFSLRDRHVPVFMLHRMQDAERGVPGHSATFLDSALNYLKTNDYNFLSLLDLVDCLEHGGSVPPKSVVFTMDDGFYDQAQIAAPIFESYQCPVTIFLLSSLSSEVSWPWDYKVEYLIKAMGKQELNFLHEDLSVQLEPGDDRGRERAIDMVRTQLYKLDTASAEIAVADLASHLGVRVPQEPPESYAPITWEMARRCESRWVQFGPHTASHSVLASQSDEVCRKEICDSWSKLKDELKSPVPVMCYPIGRKDIDFGSREMQIAREIGMRAGLSVNPGYVDIETHNNNRYALNRFNFPDSMENFIQLCSWVEVVKEKLRGR